jgi:hypothetical protein
MGTPEQNRIAKERMDMIAKKKAMAAAAMQGAGAGGIGGAAMQSGVAQGLPAAAPMQTPPPMAAPAAMPMRKRGGKVKKGC